MSENKQHFQTNDATNDKSQGSITTHLRCGEIFNSHIFYKFIAESAGEKLLKSVNIWQN